MKKVSKEKFDNFIKNYPNKLDRDFYMYVFSYHDFSLPIFLETKNCFKCIVAQEIPPEYDNEKSEYYIITDIERYALCSHLDHDGKSTYRLIASNQMKCLLCNYVVSFLTHADPFIKDNQNAN